MSMSIEDINRAFSILENAYSFFNSLPIDEGVRKVYIDELIRSAHVLLPSIAAIGAGLYLLIKEELDEADNEDEDEKKLYKELILTGISVILLIGGTAATSIALWQINNNVQTRLANPGDVS
mgnify:CR=1 FL=1